VETNKSTRLKPRFFRFRTYENCKKVRSRRLRCAGSCFVGFRDPSEGQLKKLYRWVQVEC
jgi:hypothetical protein